MTDSRHAWPSDGDPGYRRLHGSEFPDGNDRTEKVCTRCGMVKVTVHPPSGFPYREWRTREGKLWRGDATPPCLQAVAS